jgi:hypothetical protein
MKSGVKLKSHIRGLHRETCGRTVRFPACVSDFCSKVIVSSPGADQIEIRLGKECRYQGQTLQRPFMGPIENEWRNLRARLL